ncbi:MAG: hypothetical protein ABEJ64_00190 [Candidatus Nanohaloarchaea archaeon]
MHTGASLQERVLELVFAPLENPGLLPELLPLILGAFVIELYFGKHVNESLGWNTSVGNAVLWVATGLNLLLAGAIDTATERYAAYFLVAAGAFVGYMDFYHRWSPGLAFRASSADIVYPLAYVTVVVVQTGLPVDATMMKASGAFILGSLVFFRALRMIEVPARPGIQVR